MANFQQSVNEEPQSGIGGNSAGRSMWGIQQSGILQIGHHIADRRRRQLQIEATRQGPRPDRLSGLEIAVNDLTQNIGAARIQLRNRAAHRPVVSIG